MPILQLHRDVRILRAAAKAVGLEFLEGRKETPSFPWTPAEPAWMRRRYEQFLPCQHVLRLTSESSATLGRPPHPVFVYERAGHLLLVWEDHPDGFGLLAFIGPNGKGLKTSFSIEATHAVLSRYRAWDRFCEEVDQDGNITITYEDSMSQRSITVRIDKKGGTTFKTAGYEGTECKEATKTLEKALGAVESDVATEEMHLKPQEQEIDQTAGG